MYVNEIYSYFYELEEKYQIHDDHLKYQKEVTFKMRAILIDWINEVHFQFHLLLETYYMTVSIIDRYLQVSVPIDCLILLITFFLESISTAQW